VKLECGYRLDLVVEDKVVVELKCIEAFAPVHEAIMLTYLRLSGYPVGLLINFNVTILKDGLKRFVYMPPK
jgi:GxxExxY protein